MSDWCLVSLYLRTNHVEKDNMVSDFYVTFSSKHASHPLGKDFLVLFFNSRQNPDPQRAECFLLYALVAHLPRELRLFGVKRKAGTETGSGFECICASLGQFTDESALT